MALGKLYCQLDGGVLNVFVVKLLGHSCLL